jgi:hypothetical protein
LLTATYYNKFWNTAIAQFEKGKFETDHLIDHPHDNRFGLSLILRPAAPVKAAIQRVIAAFSNIEPGQYYYPRSDMHVTALSLVSCYNGFNRAAFNAADYINVVQQSVKKISAFPIEFNGITASPGCVMVQGFAAPG